MTQNKFDVTIIGAGIIGLGTAISILKKHPKIQLAILEKDQQVAAHQTGHNSGVIHSGIYYKPGSLKAKFCVEGRASMAKFCVENNLQYQKCGKLIVAYNEEEIPRLEVLMKRGNANLVQGLELIGPERIREIEPNAVGLKALYAPNTAIVNYSEVSELFAKNIKNNGAEILLNSKFLGSKTLHNSTIINTSNGDIETKCVINCAGLYSDRVAKSMGIKPKLRIIPFRGEYYSLIPEKSDLINGLIYPVPDPQFPFLGVHLTKNVKGFIEAGPNAVLAFSREGYRKIDFHPYDIINTITYPGFVKFSIKNLKTGIMEINRSFRKNIFLKDLQKMVPSLKSSDLIKGGSGVRAQAIASDGSMIDDFAIEMGNRSIHVLNAPSPGATSSLIIGDYIADLADDFINDIPPKDFEYSKSLDTDQTDSQNFNIAMLLGMVAFGSLLFALITAIAAFFVLRAIYIYEWGDNSFTHYIDTCSFEGIYLIGKYICSFLGFLGF